MRQKPPRDAGPVPAALARSSFESALADAIASAPISAPDEPFDLVEQHVVDPARARIWAGNARIYALLTEASCRDLIDSIVAEAGQKMPAIVRRVFDDPAYDYEVIVGSRRHFSVSWLRAQGRSEFGFLVQVEQLDDEAAFRLADIENRARRDVSEIERARNYAAALDAHYGGHLTGMAIRLNVSKGWLSKMIRAASLPDAIVAAFPDIRDLRLKYAYALSRAIETTEANAAVMAAAIHIAKAQRARAKDGYRLYSAGEVQATLLAAAGAAIEPTLFAQNGPNGEPLLKVTSANRRGVTLKLLPGTQASRAQIVAAIEAALDAIEAQGVSIH